MWTWENRKGLELAGSNGVGGKDPWDGSAAGGPRSHPRGLKGLIAAMPLTVIRTSGGWVMGERGGWGRDELAFNYAKTPGADVRWPHGVVEPAPSLGW